MSSSDYKLYYIDANRDRQGEIDIFDALSTRMRFNGVHTWALTIPFNSGPAAAIGRGWGIELARDDLSLYSGPARMLERVWNADNNNLILAGFSQMIRIKKHRALQVPLGPPYTAQAYDVRTGKGEDVILDYVDFNACQNAKPERRIPGISIVRNVPTIGATVTGRARMDNLLTLIQEKAIEAGGLGFEFNDMVFSVYQPEDKSADVTFSQDLGNVAAINYRIEMPEANYIYAAGANAGVARIYQENSVPETITAWGIRAEEMTDQRAISDTGELLEVIDGKLEELGEKITLAVTPIETETTRFNVDYKLGDVVGVVVENIEIQDVVREIEILLTVNDGEVLTPTVGTVGAKTMDALSDLFEQNKRAIERIDSIERNQ